MPLYFIVNTIEGEVTQTTDPAVAEEYAGSEDYFVINATAKTWMTEPSCEISIPEE